MAVTKKVIIKNNELPYITFDKVWNETESRYEIGDLYYALRYRIVTEDRNRASHWSPINKLVMPPTGQGGYFPYEDSYAISYHVGGNQGQGTQFITAIWSFPQELSDFELIFSGINVWDIWLNWKIEGAWTGWQYSSTVSGTSFSSLVPYIDTNTGATELQLAVQIPTLDKVRDFNNDKLTIFYTEGVI